MLESNLSPESMKLVVSLRRLLKKDHRISISLEEDHLLEKLFDTVRVVGDRKADDVALDLCHVLIREQGETDYLKACRIRLDPNFTPPIHEKQVGPNPKRIYRGQVIPEPAAQQATENKRPKRIYRGQVIE